MENLYNYYEGSGIFIQIGAGAGDLDSRANNRDGFTEFIKKLPKEVDPCGENGEYHSFCYSGPIFKKQINLNVLFNYYLKITAYYIQVAYHH